MIPDEAHEHADNIPSSEDNVKFKSVTPVCPSRRVLLPSVLVALIIAWGVLYMQQPALEAKAAPLGEKALKENSELNVEAASIITVSRESLIFGKPHAKVEVFLRSTAGGANSRIQGIEYNYELENDAWVLKDSGGCSGDECVTRGREVFVKQTPVL
ncbi:MAG: hypothetical protein IT366_08060 [Candidatus Hydrogenedentes bacterium]|nr:hypothetical protein [Candidatus Hydrogenedentota bacterium]